MQIYRLRPTTNSNAKEKTDLHKMSLDACKVFFFHAFWRHALYAHYIVLHGTLV